MTVDKVKSLRDIFSTYNQASPQKQNNAQAEASAQASAAPKNSDAVKVTLSDNASSGQSAGREERVARIKQQVDSGSYFEGNKSEKIAGVLADALFG